MIPGGQPHQISEGSMKTITESKLASFAVGQQKKSRFQKAREEEEKKRLKEVEEAAKIYDSFVASFEVPDAGEKAFVRGGSGGGDVYKPPQSSGSKPMTEMEKLLEELKSGDNDFQGTHSSNEIAPTKVTRV